MTDPVPSKERVDSSQVQRYIAALKAPAKAFQYCHPNTLSELTAALEELLSLRTTLRGIQSCSTCEACRGAAALALGGAAPACIHPWDRVGISGEGKPFCAQCCTNLVKDPPWVTAPEPEPTHFAFLIKRPRDKEAWPTIFASREGAEGYEHRASPVVPVCLTQPPRALSYDDFVQGHRYTPIVVTSDDGYPELRMVESPLGMWLRAVERPIPEHPDLRADAKPHCRLCGGNHWVGAHDGALQPPGAGQ